MRPILTVDLALKRYQDFGVAVVSRRKDRFQAELVRWDDAGTPEPSVVAHRIVQLAHQHDVHLILLDGTQAWKDEDNGLLHCRICEKEMHTPSKTGPPGTCKPQNYLAFTKSTVAIFDALALSGFPRLAGPPSMSQGKVSIETFPHRAWRGLGLPPLPAKTRATRTDISSRWRSLEDRFRLRCEKEPSHDELQALVSGLAGIAIQGGSTDGFACSGVAPFIKDGSMREGFIVVPKTPSTV